MTLAELERAIESARRKQKIKEKQTASFNYILADLIGISISRLYSSSTKYPPIEQVYPTLFEVDKEKEQKRQDDISIIRFKQFANNFNAKFQKDKGDEE